MLMAEFATAVKYKLPIKVVVIKNNTLGQIKWEQMVFLGNPGVRRATCSRSTSPPSRAPAAARASPSTIRPTAARFWTRRWPSAGPVLIEAVVDPNEPPMPPRITVEQAAELRRIAVRGEPNRKKIALTVLERPGQGTGFA